MLAASGVGRAAGVVEEREGGDDGWVDLVQPHTFRFGVVIGRPDPHDWIRRAQEIETLGYSSVLLPDTLGTPSPLPTLAAAVMVTRAIHLGTWVLAAPYRTAGPLIRDLTTLHQLAEGRLEVGLGAGRPGGQEDARVLGMPWGEPRERIRLVTGLVAALRTELSPAPRIVVAGSGPRMLRAASKVADIVALGVSPAADLRTVRDRTSLVQRAAGDRAGELEFSLQIAGVGDRLPWMVQQMGMSVAQLRDAHAAALLPGSVPEQVAALGRLKDEAGPTYITVPDEFADELAPAVAQLVGR